LDGTSIVVNFGGEEKVGGSSSETLVEGPACITSLEYRLESKGLVSNPRVVKAN
jgi:hypothetical protein